MATNVLSSNLVLKESPLKKLLSQGLVWSGAGETKTSAHWTSVSHRSIPFGIPEIDSALPHTGLPRNSIHELVYNDPLQPEAIATILPTIIAYNAHCNLSQSLWESTHGNVTRGDRCEPCIVWIGKRSWPTPFALESLTLNDSASRTSFLKNSIFIDTPNDTTTLWAIEIALRSKASHLVVAACPRISRATTQRFSLAARDCNSTAILLRDVRDLQLPSSASSRWELKPIPSRTTDPSWSLTLHRLKGFSVSKTTWHIRMHEVCDGLTQHSPGAPHCFTSMPNTEVTEAEQDTTYVRRASSVL